MDLAWSIYFIEVILGNDIFPNFTGFYVILTVVGYAIWTGALALHSADTDQDFAEMFNKSIKRTFKPVGWFLGVWAVIHFMTGFLPNKEAAYKIAAGWGVQTVYEAASESEDVRRMASKSLTVLEASMDKYLQEVQEVPEKEIEEVTAE